MTKKIILVMAFAFATDTAALVSTSVPAMAGQCLDGTVSVSCKTPTAVQKGAKIPVWYVADCVIGPAGGPYTKINCKEPRAVHVAPTGNEAVCFVGTDGKVHWDYQREVHVGRPFINRLVSGRWQPDWQDPAPY